MRLFLYGTLAEAQALARCGGRPLTAPPYPTLRRAPDCAVDGMLAQVTAEAMRRLVAYESQRYRRIRVRVVTAAGIVVAACFYGDAPTRVSWRVKLHQVALRTRSF